MARNYYLTRAGRLRRKDNTLCFEPSADAEQNNGAAKKSIIEELFSIGTTEQDSPDEIAPQSDEMGDLALEPEIYSNDETPFQQAAAAHDPAEDAPVRVAERRVIPIEDVDALWAFGELELNARLLNFLAQHKVPVHFFNYYGFYSGSFYPREYLNAGFVILTT